MADWAPQTALGLQAWLDTVEAQAHSWELLVAPRIGDRDPVNAAHFVEQLQDVTRRVHDLGKHVWLQRNE